MAIDEMLKSISERIGSVATVNTAFGEPRVMDHRALIPVALVMGGFGGGGGEGKTATGEEGKPREGSGGGGGGGFAVRPLAVLEVTDQQTRIIPILDVTKIILASMGLIGGTLFMLARRRSRR